MTETPGAGAPATAQAPRLWDLPVRLAHWLLAGAIAVAWATAETEAWRRLHVSAGCVAAAVVSFRLLWGWVGSAPARLAPLWRGPQAAWQELRAHLGGQSRPRSTHTVLGGWAALALWGLTLSTVASGALAFEEAGDWAADLHEAAAEALPVLIGLHLAGVAVVSLLEGENLPRTMLTGRSRHAPAAGVPRHAAAAAALLLWVGACVAAGWRLFGL